MSRQGIGIGRAVSLDFQLTDGREATYHFTDKRLWFVWIGDPKQGQIEIVQAERISTVDPTLAVAKHHQRFHGQRPQQMIDGWLSRPDPASERQMGLVVAITYDSNHMASNKADGGYYRHIFGDHGHQGMKRGPQYYPKFMADMNAVRIVRRPGNTFYFADWLIG